MATIRIPSMILRVSWLLAFVMGIVFWTGNLDTTGAHTIHEVFGILVAVSLLWLAGENVRQHGNIVLTVLGFVDAIALYLIGVDQANMLTGNGHWLIQVVHVLLAVGAIGLGEVIAARLMRAQAHAVN